MTVAERREGGIAVERAAGALGAFVTGIDASRPLSREALHALKGALAEHLVVFLPEQLLSLDALERFTDELGGRAETPFVKPIDGRPFVIRVIKEKEDKINFANAWHTDLSYLPEPPAYTVLYANEVPSYGGDTLFANQHLAHETLSDGLRATLRGLRVVHSAGFAYGTGGALDRTKHLTSMAIEPSKDAFAEHTHPAVIAHPETGRAALYVNPVYSVRIEGWSKAESEALLTYLYRHAVNENFTCRLRWRPGTVAIWDNRATQHNALNDYPGQRREMFRTSVKGSPLKGA